MRKISPFVIVIYSICLVTLFSCAPTAKSIVKETENKTILSHEEVVKRRMAEIRERTYSPSVSLKVPNDSWRLSIDKIIDAGDHVAVIVSTKRTQAVIDDWPQMARTREYLKLAASAKPVKYYIHGVSWDMDNSISNCRGWSADYKYYACIYIETNFVEPQGREITFTKQKQTEKELAIWRDSFSKLIKEKLVYTKNINTAYVSMKMMVPSKKWDLQIEKIIPKNDHIAVISKLHKLGETKDTDLYITTPTAQYHNEEKYWKLPYKFYFVNEQQIPIDEKKECAGLSKSRDLYQECIFINSDEVGELAQGSQLTIVNAQGNDPKKRDYFLPEGITSNQISFLQEKEIEITAGTANWEIEVTKVLENSEETIILIKSFEVPNTTGATSNTTRRKKIEFNSTKPVRIYEYGLNDIIPEISGEQIPFREIMSSKPSGYR